MDRLPDGWTRDRFDSFIVLKRGYDLPVSDRNEGNIPLIAASGVIDNHDTPMVEGPGIITGRSGTIGEVTYTEQNFWPLNTTLYVKDFRQNLPKYVYYFLRHFHLERFSYGTGVPTLNRNEVHPVKINFPPLAEQKKIAAILSTWDEAITLVESLIDALKRRKKGLMQRLLTGEVRGDWDTKQLRDVFTRVNRKNEERNTNVLTLSAQYGLVNQLDFFNRQIAGANIENYYLLHEGEFAYNRSYADGYPFGAIKPLELYDKGILSTLYICFGLTNEQADLTFYKHFFEAGGLNHEIYKIAQEGARNHGLLNINLQDFFDCEIPLPPLEEQHTLGQLFNLQDHIIELTKEQLDKLKQQKKGLMQRLLTGEVRVKV